MQPLPKTKICRGVAAIYINLSGMESRFRKGNKRIFVDMMEKSNFQEQFPFRGYKPRLSGREI